MAKKRKKHTPKWQAKLLETKEFLKGLNWPKIAKISLVLLIVAVCFYVFMRFTLLITVDGSKYYSYLKYFNGEASIGSWDRVRGFSFPLIIFIITKIFGDSIKGILIGFFLFYLGLLYFAIKVIKDLIKDNNLEKRSFTIWVIFASLFLFNPLIIGYSHTLLTEAVMPFFYMLTIYLCLNWNNYSFKENRKKFLIILGLLTVIAIFCWFIKQPYAPAIWLALFLTSILSGIYHKNIRIFVEKFAGFILCLILTVISIFTWNSYLDHHGNNNDSVNTSYLSNLLTTYTYHYRPISKETYCNQEFIDNTYFREKDKTKLLDFIEDNENWCDYVNFYMITDMDDKWKETEVIIREGNSLSLKESLYYYSKRLIRNPLLVMHSYYKNYLAIIDLEQALFTPEYVSSGILKADAIHENKTIGYVVFKEGQLNSWWLWQDEETIPKELLETKMGMEKFESTTTTNSKLSIIMQIFEDGSDLSFKILLFLCLPIFIYGFIQFLIHKDNLSYLMITLLSGVSFGHILFHVVMSAIIDRYCYPIYPLMLLCLVIMLMDKSKKYELKR